MMIAGFMNYISWNRVLDLTVLVVKNIFAATF